ncbi:MaoC family dehydratase [Paraburkholderia sp. NMBU_R16]|uniref:MaoC family dehydratase n=1 Tax=Paraburkholderia sp. NMBU_R16 TaxID=2698676 RepID=UPI0015643E92|nr:MaoC family dehydratase [Paraburkholderia sp. NMBU_R16]NRO96105.1 MaoC family dehydratase [Paraburkholderia sp. NMBU_R16]
MSTAARVGGREGDGDGDNRPVEIASAAQLRALIGAEPIVSAAVTIEQARIDAFADVTGDRQWIHVDAERARRESPCGGTVAHGFLTLSLIPALLMQTVHIAHRMGVNYGLNRVRFPSAVRVGARLKARFVVVDASDLPDGALQVTWDVAVEALDEPKPACVAQLLTRHYF